MSKYLICILLILLLTISCSKKSTQPDSSSLDLLQRIRALSGVEAIEVEPPAGYSRAFDIDLAVPLDHDNPSGTKIYLKVLLSHIDLNAPMSLEISGYRVTSNRIREVAAILGANQLYIGQRYMSPESQPSPLDWQYQTIEQSAADHHQLVSLFKSIYKGKWVNTGTSKGGESALIHRRFYPDDVEVTVAKVAPICFAEEDPRFDTFLNDEAGTPECRAALRQFQINILEEKETVVDYIGDYIQLSDYTFSMDPEQILEYAVLEYPFSFWQYGIGGCESVPDGSASANELYNHLLQINGLDYYSDEIHEYYGPVFYQFFTEQGYYGFVTEHLTGLLATSDNYTNKIFAPSGVEMVFHPEVMQDINNWLVTEGNNIIYVYGGRDTWTAAAVELTGQTNALKVVEPGADHSVQITELTQRDEVYDSLESWLGITIDETMAPRLFVPEKRPHNRFFDDYDLR